MCACKLVLRLNADSHRGVVGGTPVAGPASPASGNSLSATLTGWVRRSIDRILASRAVQEAIVRLNRWSAAGYQQLVDCAYPPTPLPDDLERTELLSGLDEPTDFRFLPDGRVIVTEKTGAIKLFALGNPNAAPITVATLPTRNEVERGLAGIELDPDFADNGFVYVSYTTAENYDRLSRFTLRFDSIDLDSELVLVQSAEESGPMHHGGEIKFGPDGKIYWATGDNTVSTNAALLDNIHGKILRLNPDGTAPEDNPFVGTAGADPRIYAYGLRNPFRFTFTPSGALLVGDVGWQTWEELNLVTAGGNFGWPSAEGVCSNCGYVNPVYTYPHNPLQLDSGAITSVVVYDGEALPEQYRGKVLIGDYVLGWIKELNLDSGYTAVLSERTIDSKAGTVVKLLQGPDGNLYQLNIYPGALYRIGASDGNRTPSAVMTATPVSGPSPLTVWFSSAGSSDPDPGTALTYAWDFGDGTTSTFARFVHTYAVNGSYTATLTVSDGEKTDTASQRIIVGDTAPEVEILSPVAESHYNAGEIVSFSARATDAQDGGLPDSAYEWTVTFHHGDHIHPYLRDITGPNGTVALSNSDHNEDTTWYEFTLTVTDSSGLATIRSANIRPNLVTLTFDSNEPEARYTVGGIPHYGNYTVQAVVGVVRILDAPSTQDIGDVSLVFNNWSDGGAKEHAITTPGTNTTYTVNFDRISI